MSRTRTIWSGVRPVPPATLLRWRDGRTQAETYWTLGSIATRAQLGLDEASREFRELLRTAVLASIEPEGKTWADLSGGLDSSSLVSSAAVFGKETGQALGGTVTYTDSLGGDETRFVDAVAGRFRLRNERFAEPWPWRGDGLPPPITPQPTRDFPYYARDRATAACLGTAGANSLLSGIGPDCYMPFGTRHAVDLLCSGQARAGFKQLFQWAYMRRQSIWQVLGSDVLLPFAPVAYQRRRAARRLPVPAWLPAPFLRKHGFREHWGDPEVSHGRRGRMSQAAIPRHLSMVIAALQGWRHLPGIEVRHPLLDRSLVEFCVGLALTVRSDVARPKPVLHAAMKGIVPDEVLARRCTKGSILGPRICWAFRRERASLLALLKSPVLADLGCIEPRRVLADVDAYASGGGDNETSLYTVLSLETWLASRASRYTSPVG
jgi:asparagine synthase (glutamine-hydrolysing)